MSAVVDDVSKQERRFVGCCTYGTPREQLSPIESMRFVVYDFLNLPQKQGEYLDTPILVAHGISWKLRIFPKESRHNGDFISCFLYCLDVSSSKVKNPNLCIKVIVTFEFGGYGTDTRAGTTASKVGASGSSSSKTFDDVAFTAKQSRLGWYDMYKRPSVVDELSNYLLDQEGSLIIDVHLQVYGKSTWYPKPVEKHDILEKLLASPLGSDVEFLVGGEGVERQQRFHAHTCILVHRAPVLYELIKDTNSIGTDKDPFDIPNVSPSIFKMLLLYIYTGELPERAKVNDPYVAKRLLLASDRFGCTLLKLYVESEMTAKLLTVANAADWLSLADGHSCPLLKEACMNLYTNNPTEVMASIEGWSKVQESLPLVTDLLQYSSRRFLPLHDKDYENFTVRLLRETLEKRELDLDGTRAMLIQRLKEYDNQDEGDDADAEDSNDDDDDED